MRLHISFFVCGCQGAAQEARGVSPGAAGGAAGAAAAAQALPQSDSVGLQRQVALCAVEARLVVLPRNAGSILTVRQLPANERYR